MDFPYPSMVDAELTSKINKQNPCNPGSLIVKESVLCVASTSQLSKRDRQKIMRFIEDDDVAKLHKYTKKHVISFYSEVGKKGTQQNMLHCCARVNASQCTMYILRTEYQNFPEAYEGLVNSRTSSGMTPAMLATVNFSHNFLDVLLGYGGIDIYTINSSKMTAYQIAMTTQNERAIKSFMNYESRTKKCQVINKEQLSEPFDFEPEEDSLTKVFFSCLIECITCGSYVGEPDKEKSGLKKLSAKKRSVLNIDSYFIDHVLISENKREESFGTLEWRPAAEEICNRQATLFDTFSPFDICQKNYSIKNLLIIMQSLSQHPWLLRRIIQVDRSKTNFYNVSLDVNGMQKIVNVDYNVPFVVDKNEPLFISDKKEMWPMILQKALAKAYGSFTALEKMKPAQIIKSITSWNTLSRPVGKNTIPYLQKMTEYGYMFILEGKQGSYLSDEQGNVHCFTVLNFYNKGDKRLVLVNCPFIDEAWVEKEKHEILALKLIKSHYNSHNQMCIWIEEEKLSEYFSNVIISTIMPNYERNLSIFKGKGMMFFRFTVEKSREDTVMFELLDSKTGELLDLASLKGWVNDGLSQITFEKPKPCMEQLAHLECEPAEYFCMYDFGDKPSSRYILTTLSCDSVCPEFVQDSFAIVDWLNAFKTNAVQKWQSQEYKSVTIDGNTMIVTRQNHGKKVRLEISVDRDCIMEGRFSEGGIEMLKYDDCYFYCVLRVEMAGLQIKFLVD